MNHRYWLLLVQATLLLATAAAWARPGQPIEHLVIGAELSLPLPQPLEPMVDPASIGWGRLATLPDGAAVSVAAGFPDFNLDLALHVGYRWALGYFAQGTEFSDVTASEYRADLIPLRLYARVLPMRWYVRPFAAAWLGAQVASVRYVVDDDPPELAATSVQWGAGLRLGLDVPLAVGLGLQAYAEADATTVARVGFAPGVSGTGLHFGGGLYYQLDLTPSGLAQSKSEHDEYPAVYQRLLAQERGPGGDGASQAQRRLERAFEAIREGDHLRHLKRCNEAIEHYRRGLSLLPPTAEAQRNVHVPVRLDWASCLVQMGLNDQAVLVLREAHRMDPSNIEVVSALEALGDFVQAGPAPHAAPRTPIRPTGDDQQ